MAKSNEVFIGIDVHKETLETVIDGREEGWECRNDATGRKELLTTFGVGPIHWTTDGPK